MLMTEWVNRLESIDLDRRHVLTLPPTQSMRRLLLLIWCWYPHCDSLSSCHTQSTNANHSRSPLFGWRPRWYAKHCQCVCVCTRTGRISLDIVCVPSGKHTHTHKVGNWRKSQSRAGQLWIEWKETRPTSITTCHQRAEGDRLITGGSRTPQLKATATT